MLGLHWCQDAQAKKVPSHKQRWKPSSKYQAKIILWVAITRKSKNRRRPAEFLQYPAGETFYPNQKQKLSSFLVSQADRTNVVCAKCRLIGSSETRTHLTSQPIQMHRQFTSLSLYRQSPDKVIPSRSCAGLDMQCYRS
jgi:hypothetical protein